MYINHAGRRIHFKSHDDLLVYYGKVLQATNPDPKLCAKISAKLDELDAKEEDAFGEAEGFDTEDNCPW